MAPDLSCLAQAAGELPGIESKKASASFSSAFCRLTSLTTATSESNDGLTASSKAYWSADVASSSMSSASGRAFNACAHSALVRASFKYESPPGTTVTGTFAAVFAMPPSRHTGWTMYANTVCSSTSYAGIFFHEESPDKSRRDSSIHKVRRTRHTEPKRIPGRPASGCRTRFT